MTVRKNNQNINNSNGPVEKKFMLNEVPELSDYTIKLHY